MSDETTTKQRTKSQSTGGPEVYQSEYKIRFVTAASLFDGHDASINIMRRILQSSGAEVIHLGHNRSVKEIVDCAIQEDVQGIAVSSYQGGHMEYFKYMVDLLEERGASHIKVFGGGGGVIVDEEINELEAYGVTRIFSPDDGSTMGLQGMINSMLEVCDFDTAEVEEVIPRKILERDSKTLGRCISILENGHDKILKFSEDKLLDSSENTIEPASNGQPIPLVGITGTGGAGKSSLTDELVRRFLEEFKELNIAIISIDPSKIRTGGALLGDRIRMNSIDTDRVFMRSMATRATNRTTSKAVRGAIEICKTAGFDLIIIETSGIGQSDTEIVEVADIPLYVMTSEYGAATQLEKINMLDLAELVVLNKFEKKGSRDALRDVRKQMKRNRGAWDAKPEQMPVYPTIAAQFNDEGVNRLFKALVKKINSTYNLKWESGIYTNPEPAEDIQSQAIIPGQRQRYLSEISETIRNYHQWAEEQAEIASKLEQVEGTSLQIENWDPEGKEEIGDTLEQMREHWRSKLDSRCQKILEQWDAVYEKYRQEQVDIEIRGRTFSNEMYRESLSGLKIPRVSLPKTKHKGEQLRYALKENLPGYYPFTAGVFPFKREGEDPTRMFAGEGTPERTNKRFHYVSEGMPAARLSTAFDSVTLYGEDPDHRPDIYGKVGNSGVSICTLDDMKKLYSGFELTSRKTSVSMTINGPAPMILAMFMNTAVDQEVERYLKENGEWEEAQQKIKQHFNKKGVSQPKYYGQLPETNDGFGLGLLGISGDKLVDEETYGQIKEDALKVVRGTVQADILKEDQAQNTCIFSTEFALRMMGDIQEYFTEHKVRNYYSVSISGYHIAEAGANPITQAAFTLANGFTYVEYYLSRGMDIDEFAHNLSFFFSNGLDPEYAVIGRVARRIWAVAMREKYGANKRSQKLKYHIQTSGRSLHAQEIQFNDIRTTLQALMAVYDNCNSLHTNAYDEAITTPTEESVRRALAIQLIINKELGTAKNENINQGSYFIEELTDLVEEAILSEFDRLTERGGVLGAMENMYQRGKIQDESLYYESKKHSGDLPIIGVNTFLGGDSGEEEEHDVELIRSTKEEKEQQIANLEAFHKRNSAESEKALQRLKETARNGDNIFEELMETVKVASLGQISHALYEVGGEYRRNM
ncbi:methylmalonyl-CoA mutase family protein [Aliifodinibius sp. S!AR15-10]|uniref:methylmalonyl-CoA mutase family protein n=1 Tax=Aliifodinibius sp. S!AR15-10 TaxID=2950437 RepID=UPI0028676F6D|nr:methylmalonyl-CoA mutase family protein [Aliifodinibius sp. S!AR15-10]MDR8391850.1 methylmalonyl-CoA mutase family protein [Aliifodinibius sp. S!AR15-10]